MRQVAKDLYLSCRSNPLLSFLRGLEAPHLKELTTTGVDTQQAIEAMVHTVMQASAPHLVKLRHSVVKGPPAWLC